MKVAIVHYHLRPGGVTRVIESAVESLAGHPVQTAVLSGDVYAGGRLEDCRHVDGLNYRTAGDAKAPAELADHLLAAARDALGGEPDVWHIHNHSLGKNAALPGAIRVLGRRGARFLFQIHDFAEDGRPANYRVLVEPVPGEDRVARLDSLYPQAPQIHYAGLTSRDLGMLRGAGIPESRLHLLPNPVSTDPAFVENAPPLQNPPADLRQARSKGSRLFLYPTRAIRRKNLGELLLWAASTGRDAFFATTLTPDNPVWRPIHDQWGNLAKDLGLPVKLGVADDKPDEFPSWVATADFLITTSIAEGFGLAFLEASCFGKPLTGRNIRDITRDFAQKSIDLSSLYDRLEVPMELVGENGFKSALQRGLSKTYASYGQPMPPDAVARAFGVGVRENMCDFGMLDEHLQAGVVRQVAGSPALARALRPDSLLGSAQSAATIAANRARIAESFSLDAYGRNLVGLYHRVAAAPVESPAPLPPANVLNQFLAPERFRLLRT